jgi:hypothetical protein
LINMPTRSQAAQPAQPPKEAAYTQSSNPVSHTQQEQRAPTEPTRHHGDSVASITRTANSNPSNDESIARQEKQHQKHEQEVHDASNVDLEYGVEQQPSEGYIAEMVQNKGKGMQRAQAGAHSGPVGSASGPGHPGFGEADDLMANIGRKRDDHDKMLGERVGQSPASPDEGALEREAVRARKLEHDQNLDVKGAVEKATGDPVVGN